MPDIYMYGRLSPALKAANERAKRLLDQGAVMEEDAVTRRARERAERREAELERISVAREGNYVGGVVMVSSNTTNNSEFKRTDSTREASTLYPY